MDPNEIPEIARAMAEKKVEGDAAQTRKPFRPDFLKNGKYLPSFMRDFHDQKDLFKTLHQNVNVEGHSYCKDISWVAGHCYAVDIFLWWMAKHGYTLQKSRINMEFKDLESTLKAAQEVRDRQFAQAIGLNRVSDHSGTNEVSGPQDGAHNEEAVR